MTETFDIRTIVDEMKSDAAYVKGRHTARTIVRKPDLRIVIVAMNAGSEIKEHKADETAQVHTISGQVKLRMGSETVELPAGHLLVLERGVPHNVEAVEDSVFMLTLGGHS